MDAFKYVPHIAQQVLSFLDAKSLLELKRVCKYCDVLITPIEQDLWQGLVYRELAFDWKPTLWDWKQFYRNFSESKHGVCPHLTTCSFKNLQKKLEEPIRCHNAVCPNVVGTWICIVRGCTYAYCGKGCPGNHYKTTGHALTMTRNNIKKQGKAYYYDYPYCKACDRGVGLYSERNMEEAIVMVLLNLMCK